MQVTLERSAAESAETSTDQQGHAAEHGEWLGKVASGLDLLADLTFGDVVLYVPDGGQLLVLAHSAPEPLPSLYSGSLVGQRFTRRQMPHVARMLLDGHPRRTVRGTLVQGVPAVQALFPLVDSRGTVAAVLANEITALEHGRQRRKSPVLRRAIEHVQELILAGRLASASSLSRIRVHDGPMVVDRHGRITYISAIAEHLYRRLGYGDSLLKAQLAELETNEYLFFKATELGQCMEQRIQEQEFIWVKRVIPLLPMPRRRLFGGALQLAEVAEGALIVIQDATEEVRKEQELRVKSAMMQEIHHRVKNNLQTIAALLRLQARRSGSTELEQLLQESISRILSIAVVHEFLSHDESHRISLREVARRIATEVSLGTLDPLKKVRLEVTEGPPFLLPAQQATSCALIINELVQNAVEHAFPDGREGRVTIHLGEDEESMCLSVEDDGAGLPRTFPGQSSEGLGLQIVRTLVREDLRGALELHDTGRNGVRAVVTFPRIPVQ